jgi:hypothetical protein
VLAHRESILLSGFCKKQMMSKHNKKPNSDLPELGFVMLYCILLAQWKNQGYAFKS